MTPTSPAAVVTPTGSSPPDNSGVQEVISAVQSLHSGQTKAERQAGDLWLRQWQQTPAAWVVADTLLAMDQPAEVHYTAATTLRTKIMYDFTDLPAHSHEQLGASLVTQIKRFNQLQSPVVLTALALALADLSVHTARVWKNPVETLLNAFGTPADILALLICLKVLPEENSNRRVLCDPAARAAHFRILQNSAIAVVDRLKNMRSMSEPAVVSGTGLKARIFECYVEWLSFMDAPKNQDIQTVIEPSFVEECCATLANPNDDALGEVVGDCLCEVLRIASAVPESNSQILSVALQGMTLDSPLKAAVSKAVASRDGELLLRYARVYRSVASGCLIQLTRNALGNAQLKDLLSILMLFTTQSFCTEDTAYQINGVASQILDVWSQLAEVAGRFQRRTAALRGVAVTSGFGQALDGAAADGGSVLSPISSSSEGGKGEGDEASGNAIAATTPAPPSLLTAGLSSAEATAILEYHNQLFDAVLRSLIGLCVIPESACRSASALQDFFQFRSEVLMAVADTRLVLTSPQVIEKVVQSLLTCTASVPATAEPLTVETLERLREGHLACVHRAISHIKDAPQTIGGSKSLLSLLESAAELLPENHPTTLLNCHLRHTVLELMEQAARKGWLTVRPDLIPKILERLLHQILSSTSPTPPSFSSEVQNGVPLSDLSQSTTWRETTSALSQAASSAFLAVCSTCWKEDSLQKCVPQLVLAVPKLSGCSEWAIQNVLEGLALVTAAIGEDAAFLKVSEDLFNPIISAIISAVEVDSLGKNLDRLSALLRCMTFHHDNFSRRRVLGTFITERLWPMIQQLLKSQAGDAAAVEKLGRVMKHAMRCIQDDFFKPVVLPLTNTVIENSKTNTLHPTYLYIAEWLVTEYDRDEDMIKHLTSLFNEISWLALNKIKVGLTADKSQISYMDLIEDCYGMFCRYFRFCKYIPGAAPTLPLAFEVAYPCLLQASPISVVMVLAFISNAASALRRPELEEGAVEGCCSDLQDAFNRQLEPLFYQNLPSIVDALFSLLATVPSPNVLHQINTTLAALVSNVKEDALRSCLANTISKQPPNVIVSDDYKERLIEAILARDPDALQDIAYRLKQIGMRNREVQQLASTVAAASI